MKDWYQNLGKCIPNILCYWFSGHKIQSNPHPMMAMAWREFREQMWQKERKRKSDGLLWVPHTDVTTTGGEKTPIFRKKAGWNYIKSRSCNHWISKNITQATVGELFHRSSGEKDHKTQPYWCGWILQHAHILLTLVYEEDRKTKFIIFMDTIDS